jgi:hypothetical protein
MVVVVGEAVIAEPVVPLKPVEGLQLYEAAPDADNGTEFPLQIVLLFVLKVFVTEMVGVVNTVTVVWAVLVHPPGAVPNTV